MREREIQHAIRLRLGREEDLVLFRNQVGQAKERDEETGAIRVIPYGLAKGSADLVGILRPAGRWFCLEVKAERGALRPDQRLWLELVRKFGGFAAVVRSVEEAVEALDRARKGGFE